MTTVARTLPITLLLGLALAACGGASTQPDEPRPPLETTGTAGQPTGDEPSGPATGSGSGEGENKGGLNDAGEFKVGESSGSSRPEQAKLKPTATQAAVRFFVLDKTKGPVEGVVINLSSPTGQKFYTPETNAEGFTEVLVPIATTYELVYLSLGRRNIAAKVKVDDKPMLNLKLTLRYDREEYPVGLILDKVNFPTGKATLTSESERRLDVVVEYMQHKKSARIEISGHTDNVGNKKANKKLSQARADAVRDYIVSKGVDAARLTAVGYGDEKPIASNDTPDGREQNRRIEANEL